MYFPILWCIYIYIYIYIVIHRQTVSFYQNASMWLDTQDARSRDRNPSNFTLDCVTDHSATKWTTLEKGNFKVFLFLETAAAAFVYIFYTLSATRLLNSFEELCITLAAAGNSSYTYNHVNKYLSICMHVYITILCNHIHIYACIHTHTHTHIHIYIYIYSYDPR